MEFLVVWVNLSLSQMRLIRTIKPYQSTPGPDIQSFITGNASRRAEVI